MLWIPQAQRGSPDWWYYVNAGLYIRYSGAGADALRRLERRNTTGHRIELIHLFRFGGLMSRRSGFMAGIEQSV